MTVRSEESLLRKLGSQIQVLLKDRNSVQKDEELATYAQPLPYFIALILNSINIPASLFADGKEHNVWHQASAGKGSVRLRAHIVCSHVSYIGLHSHTLR